MKKVGNSRLKPFFSKQTEHAGGDVIAGDVGDFGGDLVFREPRLFEAQRARVIDLEIGDAWDALPRGSRVEPCAEDDDLLKAASEMLVQPVVEVARSEPDIGRRCREPV